MAARHLTLGLTERLGDLVRTEAFRHAAARLGARIREEDGLRAGVEVVEGLAAS